MLETFRLFIICNLISVFAGFMLDLILGDPAWKFHPVRLIGQIVLKGEKLFYKNTFSNGFLLLLFTVFAVTGAYVVLLLTAWQVSPILYIILSALGVWSGISIKDMKIQVNRVCEALEKQDLERARQMLALLVSRDTRQMDEEKIISSCIETVSENFTDAALSPIMYGLIGGGGTVIFFKCVSTLDSMVGYRNDKYDRFGTASARMDDMLNFIPARLSIIPLFFGALWARANIRGAFRCYFKHRKSHASPNSAHSIAAFAGALGVCLGGPTSYGGVIYDKMVIEGGAEKLDVDKIHKALDIYRDSAFFAVMSGMVRFWVIGKVLFVSL